MLLSRYRLGLTALAVGLLALSGCSGRPAVEGTVTFNKEPVDGGVISFVPSTGSANEGRVSADIVQGKFTLPSGHGPKPGTYKVEIVWNKKTGRQIDTPGDVGVKMDEKVQVIPDKYNKKTTETAEIKSSGNKFDFNLTP
jgi:hypothetical protein